MCQGVGLPCLFSQVLGSILQAGEAGPQVRVLAEHGHFQLALYPAAVGVHLCNQWIGRGLLGQGQQAFEPALLPAQTDQPQRYRECRGQGKPPGRIQPGTNGETDLADQDKGQPVAQHGPPAIALGNGGLACIQALIEVLGATDLLARGFDSNGLETHNPIVLEDRCDIGIDPVMVTALAAVLDDAHPRQALLERGPHVCEHRCRHVRVAHQVMRRTYQLLAGEPTDLDEGVVAVRNDPLGVGGRDQPLLGRESPFALGDGLVIAHELFNP
ncbi:hypothetical protein D3C85_822670 [compost metagenome]